MNAVSPVIPGENFDELIVAENQPEYENLPVIVMSDGVVLSRWKLSEEERRIVAETGDIYLFMWGRPVKPLMLQVEKPELVSKPAVEDELPLSVTSMSVLRSTPERKEKAESLGLTITMDKCAGCGEEVLVANDTRELQKTHPNLILICFECTKQVKAENPDFTLRKLPETLELLKQMSNNLGNQENDLINCRGCQLICAVTPELRCANCGEFICLHCGCTDSAACAGGCSWERPGVCSNCVD